MQPTKTDNRIESTITGKKIAMSLDEQSLAHLMKVLTVLYSDNEMAIIREYSTNALDSHIEAGIDKPIKVTLPTSLVPYLTVQDFGTGMDIDTITEIYSKYGASTKRGTNDQTGMLGLGCKSALAYTDQFTLTGVKDGIRSMVIVSREEDGSGSMTVVSETPTDEPNGVKVEIPVKKYNDIAGKAAKFFRFWRPGTVLINDKEPEYVQGDWITKDILVQEGESQSYLVMGGVPYPVELNHGLNGSAIIAFIGIGEAGFLPNREKLDDSRETMATIERTTKKFHDALARAIQKDIDAQPDLRSALLAAIKWRYKLGKGALATATTLSYKGNVIPLRYEFEPVKDKDGYVVHQDRFIVSRSNSMKVSAHDKDPSVAASVMVDALIVKDYDLTFTPAHKRKMEKYANETVGFDPGYYICCKELPKGIEWLDSSRIVSYEVIKEIKLPQYIKAPGAARVKGSYDVRVNYHTTPNVLATDLKQLASIYFMTTNGSTVPKKKEDSLFRLITKHIGGDASVVMLPINREAKFKRDFPEAIPVMTALAAVYEKLASSIPKEVFEAQYIRSNFYHDGYVKYLKPGMPYKDPEINRTIAAFDVDCSPADKVQEFASFSYYLGTKAPSAPKITWSDPFQDYPLWSWSYSDLRNNMNHAKLYVDTAYKLVKPTRTKRKAKK